VFPTLTALLVWRYLQVNLHFNIQHHTKSGQYPYIQVPIEDLEVKDRPNEDWFSLVDAERERPIPQHFECKNLQTAISIVCQFSSNCSIKLLPERVDWRLD
jgi:hypothetical protein